MREKVEPGTFEGLQTEILDGVLDTHDANTRTDMRASSP